jgi:hypothetical protein
MREDGMLELQVQPGAGNDDFADRLVLIGAVVVQRGTTLGATRETGEPAHASRTSGASVWYDWTAPADGAWVASVVTGLPHVLRVFTTSEPGEAVSYGAADTVWWTWKAPADGLARMEVAALDGAVLTPVVFLESPATWATNVATFLPTTLVPRVLASTFAVSQGQIYDIQVATGSGDSTNLTLTLTLEPHAPLAIDWLDRGKDWMGEGARRAGEGRASGLGARGGIERHVTSR